MHSKEPSLAARKATRTRFELCSKFIYRIGKDGKRVNPDLRAHVEDAQDAFMATLSVLNRLAKKSRRHGRPR